MTFTVRPRSLVPLDSLNRMARNRAGPQDEPDWKRALDDTLPFICPTLTPLYHTPSYSWLTPRQQLRYNQIVALSFNEVIAFFEESLAGSVLTHMSRHRAAPEELRASVAHFHDEEATHTVIFRRLNRLAAPQWYQSRDDYILHFTPMAKRVMAFIGRHAVRFPFIFWVMLAMEERSLEISRRYGALPANRVEPHFAAVYRSHMKDETRHVQIDWHLIEQFYAPLPHAARVLNVRFFASAVRRYLLAPRTAGRRVLDVLIGEFPELAPRRRIMLRELAALEHHADYQSALFSPTATPITFRLMDRFPEFRGMGRILRCYQAGQTAQEVFA